MDNKNVRDLENMACKEMLKDYSVLKKKINKEVKKKIILRKFRDIVAVRERIL